MSGHVQIFGSVDERFPSWEYSIITVNERFVQVKYPVTAQPLRKRS